MTGARTAARRAAKKRVYTSFTAALAALAAAILIGLVGGQVTSLPERITTAGDTFALTSAPQKWTGNEDYLVAGGYEGGAAISYLKFDVKLPDDRLPRRAWLWLGVSKGPLPEAVELTHVPDASWHESRITAANAPRLGKVVASVYPKPNAPAIAFDISKVLRGSGTFSFAVTAPSSTESARFVAREALTSMTGPPTITLEWSTATLSSASASSTSASASAQQPPVGDLEPPAFTPSPRDSELPPVVAPPTVAPSSEPLPVEPSSAAPLPVEPSPVAPPPVVPPWPSASPSLIATASVSPSASPSPAAPQPPSGTASPAGSASPSPSDSSPPTEPPAPVECVVGQLLVPTCGALSGVAPGAHTPQDRSEALAEFEKRVAQPQLIYHGYHRGFELFPTQAQIALARDANNPRMLFLNWKPWHATWGEIAAGDRDTDAYLDRLAAHIKSVFPEQFFFTMHHEPENDVNQQAGSGRTAKDYAAAFRHVVKRLRANGVTNIVTTMCYMAYVPWNTKPWFVELYPGDDVVDWISWDIYAYSEPGYGFGDFAEMMNRRSGNKPGWPGFYNWAARTFPDKPLMVAEWGVWYSPNNPGHHADFFESARLQLELFPRVKAYVYFETPSDQSGRDSRVQMTDNGLRSFQRFSDHPAFDVKLSRRQGNGRGESPWSDPPTSPWSEAPAPLPSRLS